MFKPESKSVVIVPANQLSWGLGYPLSLFISIRLFANISKFSSAVTKSFKILASAWDKPGIFIPCLVQVKTLMALPTVYGSPTIFLFKSLGLIFISFFNALKSFAKETWAFDISILALANGSKKFSFIQAIVASPSFPFPAKYLVKPTKSCADGGIPAQSHLPLVPPTALALVLPYCFSLPIPVALSIMLLNCPLKSSVSLFLNLACWASVSKRSISFITFWFVSDLANFILLGKIFSLNDLALDSDFLKDGVVLLPCESIPNWSPNNLPLVISIDCGLIPPSIAPTLELKYLCHQKFSPSLHPKGMPLPNLAILSLSFCALSKAISL